MTPPQALLSAGGIGWNNIEDSVGSCVWLSLRIIAILPTVSSPQYPKTLLLIGTDIMWCLGRMCLGRGCESVILKAGR